MPDFGSAFAETFLQAQGQQMQRALAIADRVMQGRRDEHAQQMDAARQKYLQDKQDSDSQQAEDDKAWRVDPRNPDVVRANATAKYYDDRIGARKDAGTQTAINNAA